MSNYESYVFRLEELKHQTAYVLLWQHTIGIYSTLLVNDVLIVSIDISENKTEIRFDDAKCKTNFSLIALNF